MKQYRSTFTIVFVSLLVIIFVYGIVSGRDIRYMGSGRADAPQAEGEEKDAPRTEEESVPATGTDSATLSVATQMPGATVLVDRVQLGKDGWVVVHEIEKGHVLNALGARRLDAGSHEKVSVELLRATDPGREYAIILYADNGNKEFEVRGDLPMIDAKGNPLMHTFKTFGGGANGQ